MARKRHKLFAGVELARAHREVMRLVPKPFRFSYAKRTFRRAKHSAFKR